jgi:hypothetical protein
MNSKLLLAFLCVVSLSTGCIIHQDDDDCCGPPVPPPPTQPGDVTFLWMFDGLRCDEARDVYGVNITIPGEQLHNNGRYACSTSGVDGITLHDFVPGTYSYRIQAVDYRNVVLFESTGTFVINGDARVTVDLAPVGNNTNTAYAFLNWTLPGNKTCAQAGVATVDVRLDNNPNTSITGVLCAEGQSAQGWRMPYTTPGDHRIDIIARAENGSALYYFTGGLTTRAYAPVNATYSLTSGGASISWKFSDGSVTYDCAQADASGNLRVGLNFQDTSTGEWVYGDAGDFHLCSGKPIVYAFLRPGFYKISLYAKTASGVEYRSNPSIPSLEVRANVYPTAAQALEVTLFRQ